MNESLIDEVHRSLTDRDIRICQLLQDHRVLTAHQLASLLFPTYKSARVRLVHLYRHRVIDRFRPVQTPGSALYHYTLGVIGAAVCAAQRGKEPKYRQQRIAEVWQRTDKLRHLMMVNDFFANLAGARLSDDSSELTDWWSEWRCAKAMAGIVYPDGFGEFWQQGCVVEFYFEADRGTENRTRLLEKIEAYDRLRKGTGVDRPVLFWMPTLRREESVRRALSGVDIPVATAVVNDRPWGPCWRLLGEQSQFRLVDL